MKKFFILLFAIFTLSATYFLATGKHTLPVKTTKINTVSQKIIYNNQADKKEISIEEGKTALDALKKSADIESKGEGENAFVVEINGIKPDEKKKEFWAFFVNGKEASVGAGSYKLKYGDQIEWKLSTY